MALTGGKFAPQAGKRAVVAATATGAVLGTVTPPRPYGMFTEVAGARDDRMFVLAAQRAVPFSQGSPWLTGDGPARLYKLVLNRSGRPGQLTALPVPPIAGSIDGFALSPDGSKLAVSLQPPTRLGRPGPAPPTFTTVVTVTEVSARTGKSIRVLGQRQVPGIASQWVLWTNPTGTTLIVAGPGPGTTQRNQNTVLGIQAGNTFTPLPPRVQSFQGQSPTW